MTLCSLVHSLPEDLCDKPLLLGSLTTHQLVGISLHSVCKALVGCSVLLGGNQHTNGACLSGKQLGSDGRYRTETVELVGTAEWGTTFFCFTSCNSSLKRDSSGVLPMTLATPFTICQPLPTSTPPDLALVSVIQGQNALF